MIINTLRKTQKTQFINLSAYWRNGKHDILKQTHVSIPLTTKVKMEVKTMCLVVTYGNTTAELRAGGGAAELRPQRPPGHVCAVRAGQ